MTLLTEEIKGQIDRVVSDGQVTKEELSELKKSLGCLAPEALSDIRAYIDAKTQIHADARSELQNLFAECIPDTMSNPEKVFHGTRSEIFSPASRRDIAKVVSDALNLKSYPFVTPERRENILLAVTDRFIHDPEFQSMVNLGINFAQMANTFVRSIVSDEKSESDVKATTEQAKTKAASFEEQISRIVARSIEPIKKWLEQKKITDITASVLDDPRALARYDGGDAPASTATIDAETLRQYIQGLNTEVRAIDKKILPLETIREQGLNFIAQMPEWASGILADILKWIVKTLPFLGNIIARMTGYRDAADFDRGLDEELRQRRSLGVLRQFGRIRDMDGKESDGKYKGKIKLLEDRDLSGVNRKKLGDFFAFTKEVWVKTDTSEFWTGVFNDGKIVAKDAEGKDEVHELQEKITEKDLEEDFTGLYRKLNKFPSLRDSKKRATEERAREDAERVDRDARVREREQEQARAHAELLSEQAKEEARIKPFDDLARWEVDTPLARILVNVRVANLRDGKYEQLTRIALHDSKYDSIRESVLASFSVLSRVIKEIPDARLEAILGTDKTFGNLYVKRNELIAASGLAMNMESTAMKQARERLAALEKARDREKYSQTRDAALMRMLSDAKKLPIALDWKKYGVADLSVAREFGVVYPEGGIDFDFDKQRLVIGNRHFDVRALPFDTKIRGVMPAHVDNVRITEILVGAGEFSLTGVWDATVVGGKLSNQKSDTPIVVPISDMSRLVSSLIDATSNKAIAHAFDKQLEIRPIA